MTTIAQQLDQVLALFDLPDTPLNGVLVAEHCYAFMKEHGPAIRAAVGGEAVVVAYRWLRNGEPSQWFDGTPSSRELQAQKDCAAVATWTVEYAYSQPPATVDVGALRELVEKWRAREGAMLAQYSEELKRCADELAALIRTNG